MVNLKENLQIRVLQMTLDDVKRDFAVSDLYISKHLKDNIERVKKEIISLTDQSKGEKNGKTD